MSDHKSILGVELTPDKIASKLFSYHAKAHFFHLQTTSYAQHKALNKLYNSLEELKDSICEFLLGVQAPKRFGNLQIESPGSFNDSMLKSFIEEGCTFTMQLCKYAESNKLEQLCNLSSELQGTFVQTRYLLSLN